MCVGGWGVGGDQVLLRVVDGFGSMLGDFGLRGATEMNEFGVIGLIKRLIT